MNINLQKCLDYYPNGGYDTTIKEMECDKWRNR